MNKLTTKQEIVDAKKKELQTWAEKNINPNKDVRIMFYDWAMCVCVEVYSIRDGKWTLVKSESVI